MLGSEPFQYENILITPLGGKFVKGDALILSWDRINKVVPGQAVSLAVYHEDKGIEWCIDSHNYVQFFVRVDLSHDKAVCHWVFDYVLRDAERKHLPAEKLKLRELAAQGKYQDIFIHLEELLKGYDVPSV